MHLVRVDIKNKDTLYVDEKLNIYSFHKGYLERCLPHKSSVSYLEVSFNGNREYVHRIMAQAFLIDWDSNLHVNHIDGNKLNNSPSNLEMVTHSQNMNHSYKIGLMNHKGSNNPFAKLTEEDVRYIRKNANIGSVSLGKMFNVDRQTITGIVKRVSWRHI